MSEAKEIKKSAVFLIILISFNITSANRIIYVDDDAAGANDGSSWENAYIYLQDALADANDSEKPVEIRVAQGIYKPDQGAEQTPGDRDALFKLKSGLERIEKDKQERYKLFRDKITNFCPGQFHCPFQSLILHFVIRRFFFNHNFFGICRIRKANSPLKRTKSNFHRIKVSLFF